MTDADRVFARFPDFIKEYIYSHGWDELREIQLEAAEAIFESNENLLLSSSTASGKTEAVFFPVITDIVENPAPEKSVAVLYIAPLKSLINDQFYRLDELLDMTGITLTHWHADVGVSHKQRLLRDPEGILQITPESLEAMLMNRKSDIPRIFGNLKYVIIDEIHSLINSDRGNQVICLLTRIARLIGYHPRRIGLSATLGDVEMAKEWLSSGSGRGTIAPTPEKTALKWRIGYEHFYYQNPNEDQTSTVPDTSDRGGYATLDPGYEFLYDSIAARKALVFSNSREETEYVTASLRQIARARGEDDIFYIHHGNLSASLREDAELKMKDESVTEAVTCATVTMELGIDIGRLERVAQVSAPTSVSGFLQRLGRSGRRGNPPEMIMLFREEEPLPNAQLPEILPWDLLRGVAILDLYARERFIEPPYVKEMPLSLAFHQTLSILVSEGELTARKLADKVLSLPPISHLSRDIYKELIVSMINDDYIEMTEEQGLIVGMKGERLVNSYKFYAVFKDSEDYTVRCDSKEIGTITTPPPVGDRFALAGSVWEVIELDVKRRLVFVCAVEGKMEVSWPGNGGEIHTKILLAMKDVLFNELDYRFLGDNAAERLRKARQVAKKAGINKNMVVHLGGQSYVLFPWLGTKPFKTMQRFMKKNASELGISDIKSQGCYYIKFKMKDGSAQRFLTGVKTILKRDGLSTDELVGENEHPVYEKYDEYIPSNLLRRCFARDRLSAKEVVERFK